MRLQERRSLVHFLFFPAFVLVLPFPSPAAYLSISPAPSRNARSFSSVPLASKGAKIFYRAVADQESHTRPAIARGPFYPICFPLELFLLLKDLEQSQIVHRSELDDHIKDHLPERRLCSGTLGICYLLERLPGCIANRHQSGLTMFLSAYVWQCLPRHFTVLVTSVRPSPIGFFFVLVTRTLAWQILHFVISITY